MDYRTNVVQRRKRVIGHPEFGEVKYSTIYFEMEEPILFSCTFQNTPDKYIGMRVDEIGDFDSTIKVYYFVGVLNNEISLLEKKQGKLKELFDNRPVLKCVARITGEDIVQSWYKKDKIDYAYSPTDKASLQCNRLGT
jgi:hypothetical protein